jgi:hypothetical protein
LDCGGCGSLIILTHVIKKIKWKDGMGGECDTYVKENPWMVLVTETEGKSPLGRCRHKWRSKSRVILK